MSLPDAKSYLSSYIYYHHKPASIMEKCIRQAQRDALKAAVELCLNKRNNYSSNAYTEYKAGKITNAEILSLKADTCDDLGTLIRTVMPEEKSDG